MASLVGDVIMQFRDLALDPPQVMQAPILVTIVGATLGGTVAPGTYFVVMTALNQWGQTVASNEMSVVVGGGQDSIQITAFDPPFGNNGSYNIYIGSSAGGEDFFIPVTGVFTTPINITSFAGTPGAPPPTSSAYLPDTDGSYLRAATVFRWLNDSLRQSSRLAGGLPDYSGFPSTINFATYIVTGEWTRMIQAWYDGYPVSFSPTGAFFKRNIVTSSILAGWAISFYNNQMGVELWPQPARTATQTTLAAPMLATDTVATLTTTAGFLLPTYGMVQIGTEICAYNGISAPNLTGLIRGLGGTVPTAWASATQVNELNAFFQGRRVFNTQYTPGQSMVNLPIPSGWEGVLINFLMSKFYETERDSQNAAASMKQFKDEILGYLRMNRQIAGPQQVGSRDYQFVVFGGTRFGGNVIP
jgi:hypothetical protein